jgi:hypothetical protein
MMDYSFDKYKEDEENKVAADSMPANITAGEFNNLRKLIYDSKSKIEDLERKVELLETKLLRFVVIWLEEDKTMRGRG